MSQIEGYENYTINEDGKVINTNNGREKKPSINNNGYYRVYLSKNGKQKLFTLHRLIAQAFIPNPDNKPCVDHINRNKQDNRIENLRWATESENMKNRSCFSNTGLQHISKNKSKTYKQGYFYRFELRRPELINNYANKDLEVVKEYRNKFCLENNIEINDIL